MDINIVGRNLDITDRFREYVTEKSDKVTNLVDRPHSFEIKVSRHNEKVGVHNGDQRVELTLVAPKAVVRAEASGTDKYVAFDIALGRLMERLRRAKDRRKVHRGQHRPLSLREASTDGFSEVALDAASVDTLEAVVTGNTPIAESGVRPDDDGSDYSPVVIRRKVFATEPMSIDDALYYMELVGHDFYLFIDGDTHRPSVVYRRKGWDYGVIALDDDAKQSQNIATMDRARR